MRYRDKALAVLRRAIRDEVAGQRFYSDAAFYCIDLWAKDLFATLARDEEEHARLLLVEHEALATGGRWIELEAARAREVKMDLVDLDLSNEGSDELLFSPQWSVESSVDRRADDLAALAFGIKMEERAIGLYGEAARTAENRAVREAYSFLVEEEIRHREQLRTRWESLTGTAWNEALDGDTQ